jgi:hypothetical protein
MQTPSAKALTPKPRAQIGAYEGLGHLGATVELDAQSRVGINRMPVGHTFTAGVKGPVPRGAGTDVRAGLPEPSYRIDHVLVRCLAAYPYRGDA